MFKAKVGALAPTVASSTYIYIYIYIWMSPIRRHTRRARENGFLFKSVARVGRAQDGHSHAPVARGSLARVDRVGVGHSRDDLFNIS